MQQKTIPKSYNGVKVGFWYTMGNILIKGIPFFSLPVFTRLLSTADFGVYNAYIAYEGILNVFIGLGIAGTIKTAYFDFKSNFEQYVSSTLKLILIVAIGFLAVGNIGMYFFEMRGWLTRYTLMLLILQSMATAIYGVMSIKYVITGAYIKNLTIASSVMTLNIGLSILLCFWGFSEEPALARITGTAVGSISVSAMLVIMQKRKAPFITCSKANFYSLKFGLPLIPHQLSLIIMTQCDKLMIQKMAGDSAVGIYSLAANIVTVLTVLLSSIDSAWAPWYYGSLKTRAFREIRRINGDLLVFFMYLTSGFLLTGVDVIHIMAEKSYWESVNVLIPLAVSVYLSFMYLYDVNLEYFYKKTVYISYTSVLCAALNMVMNFIFISRGGYMAAAYATCIAKFMLFILHHVRARKLEKEKVVQESYLLITLWIVLVNAWLASVFSNTAYIRYLIVGIMTVLTGIYFYKSGYLKKIQMRGR